VFPPTAVVGLTVRRVKKIVRRLPILLSFFPKAGGFPRRCYGHYRGLSLLCRTPNNMSIELTRSFFLWCTVINYGILLLWFLVFAIARDWMRRFHGRWFRLSEEQFDALHYVGMSIYKIGILLFNLVPFIVLWIVG
jgi:Family of unknown function (DUF6868)